MDELDAANKKILEEGKGIPLGQCKDIELDTEDGRMIAEVCRTADNRLEVKRIKK